jgi:hypothetical protein
MIRARTVGVKWEGRRNGGYRRFQRSAAAFLAIALRFAGDRTFARALAPAWPLRTRPDLGLSTSSISPVAILPTMTAAPITSAGRFSPRGPRGMADLSGLGGYNLANRRSALRMASGLLDDRRASPSAPNVMLFGLFDYARKIQTEALPSTAATCLAVGVTWHRSLLVELWVRRHAELRLVAGGAQLLCPRQLFSAWVAASGFSSCFCGLPRGTASLARARK